jgi:hypothetical protein
VKPRLSPYLAYEIKPQFDLTGVLPKKKTKLAILPQLQEAFLAEYPRPATNG